MREAAEYPNSFIELGPQDERVETERFTLKAGSMSAPILQRLGFVPVGRIDMLIDEFGAG